MELKQFISNENEKPLDSFPLNGGFCGIFRKIGAVGDSLSSGEFEVVKEDGSKEYHDCFDFSSNRSLKYAVFCFTNSKNLGIL